MKMLNSEFMEKFEVDEETGSYLYKTTACFDRHNVPREQMMDTKVIRFGTIETWKEGQLMNRVAELVNRGYKIRPEETLEEFIDRHMEV
jgi:hypothetical protein